MSTTPIAQNLNAVLQEIAAAARDGGRDPDDVRLVAVSKNASCNEIRQAYDAGQRHFGENRVQALCRKAEQLPEDIHWHFIGHLQRNKVARVLPVAGLVHSIDSERLLRHINRHADEACPQEILIQVDLAGEESKFGVTREEAIALAQLAVDLEGVACRGFMTMAPYGAEAEELENIFEDLWGIREYMREQHALLMPELSMGMSMDYRAAIAAGATLVRIGTAIFGPASA